MQETENLLSPQQAAALLGVTPAAIYLAMDDGRLPHCVVAGRRLVNRADLTGYAPRAYGDRPGVKGSGGRPRKEPATNK